jgi:hypothetical protein
MVDSYMTTQHKETRRAQPRGLKPAEMASWRSMVAGRYSALARAKKSGDKDRIIQAANRCLSLCSSTQRLQKMISAIVDQPPEIFWPVWLDNWSTVDYGGHLHCHLPVIFKRQGSALPHLNDEAKAHFDSLPNLLTVYRGCHERFKDGVSWTRSRKVAGYFASGGRYRPPSRPVIVTARIKKRSFNFYYCDNTRHEAEIVCTPTIEAVEPYTGPWPGDSDYTTPWAAS